MRTLIVTLFAVTICSLPPPAHSGEGPMASYVISTDSTRVSAVSGGKELISAQELLYSLPDSVYAVEY